MGAVPLRIVEPPALVQRYLGANKLTAKEQAGPQGVVGLQQALAKFVGRVLKPWQLERPPCTATNAGQAQQDRLW